MGIDSREARGAVVGVGTMHSGPRAFVSHSQSFAGRAPDWTFNVIVYCLFDATRPKTVRPPSFDLTFETCQRGSCKDSRLFRGMRGVMVMC